MQVPSADVCEVWWSGLPSPPSWQRAFPVLAAGLHAAHRHGLLLSDALTPDTHWQKTIFVKYEFKKIFFFVFQIMGTYKLICPSSSCRAKSKSDSKVSDWSAGGLSDCGAESENSFWRFFLTPHPGLCKEITRSQSWGWWCFIMWRMLWTLACTEWLGLVDYGG